MTADQGALRARNIGIDTLSEPVIFLHENCPVCRSEGFSSFNRVEVRTEARAIIATLYRVTTDMVGRNDAALSSAAWKSLALGEGAYVRVRHAPPVESLKFVRKRVFGHPLAGPDFQEIVSDIVRGRYSAVEMAAFVTACATSALTPEETEHLTLAMVGTGETLRWDAPMIMDKHSVGGLPGNRTTPIIVAIATALGLTMPKTSSHAITSPAGTADTMETLAPVDLDAASIRRVVEKEGGCIAWGGAVHLSPADDVLIRVERALDIDGEGQMIASILSKKIAAGATHLVVDMPVGATAKVRTEEAGATLAKGLRAVAEKFGLRIAIVPGEGRQPIGRGIGPALEARDVLAVLKGERSAPRDLRERSLVLAGAVLELAGRAPAGGGTGLAAAVLADGRAWRKFQRICEAQGGMRQPPEASYRTELPALHDGRLLQIDNRRISRLAKLAGAPFDRAAGVDLHVRLGDIVSRGMPLCTLQAESPGELAYALDYARANLDMFGIEA